MLRKIFNFVVIVCAKIAALIFPPRLSKSVSVWYNRFYTLWISDVFKTPGSDNYINYPIYIDGGKYISIGNGCSFGKRLRLEAIDRYLEYQFLPEISIGSNVDISSDCHIGAVNKIIIGDNVLIASKVYISDHSHGRINSEELSLTPRNREIYSKGAVIIENNAWIGENVSILPNVIIGTNSIIGANSVVTKSIPANCIAVGIPAKVIRTI